MRSFYCCYWSRFFSLHCSTPSVVATGGVFFSLPCNTSSVQVVGFPKQHQMTLRTYGSRFYALLVAMFMFLGFYGAWASTLTAMEEPLFLHEMRASWLAVDPPLRLLCTQTRLCFSLTSRAPVVRRSRGFFKESLKNQAKSLLGQPPQFPMARWFASSRRFGEV
jgi:hypothetical protein